MILVFYHPIFSQIKKKKKIDCLCKNYLTKTFSDINHKTIEGKFSEKGFLMEKYIIYTPVKNKRKKTHVANSTLDRSIFLKLTVAAFKKYL